MRKKTLFLLALLSVAASAGAMEQLKLAMEQALQDRIEGALSKIIDPGQFLVIVQVEPFSAQEISQRGRASSPAPAQSTDNILPGIERPFSMSRAAADKTVSADVFGQSKPFIKRVSITLFLDDRVYADTAQKIEVLIKQLADFNPARNDELKVQKMRLNSHTSGAGPASWGNLTVGISELPKRNDFYWILMAGLVCLGVLVFLFGPALFFLMHLPKVLREAFPPMAGGAAPAAPLAAAPSGGGGGTGLTRGELTLGADRPLTFVMESKPEGQMEIFVGEREKVAYNFINEQDIVSILTLLKDEPSLHLAIICYHLRPELAAGLLSRLDASLRKQVVEHLSSPQVLMREDVKSLGESLKHNVRGLLYGVDQFFAIYDTAAPGAQGDMIKTLETNTPMLVEKIKNEMFAFDDLMALDTSMLRIVFREVPLRTLAVALMGSPVAMRDRVLGVLPQGAAEIIRQEIDLNPVRSQKIIDDERRKVVQVVRRLVWDKKIVMPPRKAGIRSSGTAVSVKG